MELLFIFLYNNATLLKTMKSKENSLNSHIVNDLSHSLTPFYYYFVNLDMLFRARRGYSYKP